MATPYQNQLLSIKTELDYNKVMKIKNATSDLIINALPDKIASEFTRYELEAIINFWDEYFKSEEDDESTFDIHLFSGWVKAYSPSQAYEEIYGEEKFKGKVIEFIAEYDFDEAPNEEDIDFDNLPSYVDDEFKNLLDKNYHCVICNEPEIFNGKILFCNVYFYYDFNNI